MGGDVKSFSGWHRAHPGGPWVRVCRAVSEGACEQALARALEFRPGERLVVFGQGDPNLGTPAEWRPD